MALAIRESASGSRVGKLAFLVLGEGASLLRCWGLSGYDAYMASSAAVFRTSKRLVPELTVDGIVLNADLATTGKALLFEILMNST